MPTHHQIRIQQADQILTDQILVQRVSVGQRNKLVKLLTSLRAFILGDVVQAKTRREIESVIARARDLINDGYDNMAIVLLEAATRVAEHSSVVAAEAIGRSNQVNPEKISSALLVLGSSIKSWMNKQAFDVAFSVEAILRNSYVEKFSVGQTVARLRPVLTDVPIRHIRGLANSALAAAANDARLSVYESHASHMLAVQQLSTLDSHTSEICMAYSGAKWTIPDYKPIDGAPAFNGGTPRHFNCRSVIVPITKFSDEPGKRVSELGLVDRNMTFDAFLSRKTKAQQDEMLGEGKADLWRRKVITLRDLVSQEGRPLTLGQLRTKHNIDS